MQKSTKQDILVVLRSAEIGCANGRDYLTRRELDQLHHIAAFCRDLLSDNPDLNRLSRNPVAETVIMMIRDVTASRARDEMQQAANAMINEARELTAALARS